jgi:hypothetical protein
MTKLETLVNTAEHGHQCSTFNVQHPKWNGIFFWVVIFQTDDPIGDMHESRMLTIYTKIKQRLLS